jgi:hypothetical protein
MASTRRLTLTHNVETDKWDLKDERTRRLIKAFRTKTDATRRGVLEKEVGPDGGSVTIRKKGGVFEEERRFAGR